MQADVHRGCMPSELHLTCSSAAAQRPRSCGQPKQAERWLHMQAGSGAHRVAAGHEHQHLQGAPRARGLQPHQPRQRCQALLAWNLHRHGIDKCPYISCRSSSLRQGCHARAAKMFSTFAAVIESGSRWNASGVLAALSSHDSESRKMQHANSSTAMCAHIQAFYQRSQTYLHSELLELGGNTAEVWAGRCFCCFSLEGEVPMLLIAAFSQRCVWLV